MKPEMRFIIEIEKTKRDFTKSINQDEFFELANQIGYEDSERLELDIENDLLMGEDSFRFNNFRFDD
jgi:hypothetical protein